jgi:hypothetical protein
VEVKKKNNASVVFVHCHNNPKYNIKTQQIVLDLLCHAITISKRLIRANISGDFVHNMTIMPKCRERYDIMVASL